MPICTVCYDYRLESIDSFVGFVSRLEWKMEPQLRIKRQGVHFPVSIEKERAGTPPRLVEQFASRLALIEQGLGSPTRSIEQETSPFQIDGPFLSQEPCIILTVLTQLPSTLNPRVVNSTSS